MVSPPATSLAKSSSLSYADRAKKAHNSRPPNPPGDSHPHSIPAPNSNGILPMVPITGGGGEGKTISALNTPTPVAISTPQPPSSNHAGEGLPNGNTQPSKDLVFRALSIVAANTSMHKSPVTNVWSIRKERMATRLASTQESSTAPQHLQHSVSTPEKSSRQMLSPNKQPSPIPPMNSSNNVYPGVGDASMRTHMQKPHIPTPCPDHNVDAWPEVGKPMATSAAQISGVKDELGGVDSIQSPPTPRKSEKTKWVQIPPEELQAAADAGQSGRKPRSGKGSQHGHRTEKPGSSSGSVSGQSHSHSGRNSTSHSTSQSRVHSQSGSLQSSPRFPRGKGLPAEEPAATGASGHGIGQTLTGNPSGEQVFPVSYTPSSHEAPHTSNLEYPLTTHIHGVARDDGFTTYYTHQSHLSRSSPSTYNHPPAPPMYMPPNGYHSSHSSTPSLPSTPSNLDPNASLYPNHPARGSSDYAAGQPYSNFTNPSQHGNLSYHHYINNHYPSLPHPRTGPLHHSLEHGNVSKLQHQKTTRPPPPQKSQAVASYKTPEVTRGSNNEAVKFGSSSDENGYLSPAPSSPVNTVINVDGDLEKSFTAIAIGISPDNLPPHHTQSHKKRRKLTIISSTNRGESSQEKQPLATNSAFKTVEIGLQVKWEFGTAGVVPSQGIIIAPAEILNTSLAATNALDVDVDVSTSPSSGTRVGTAELQLTEGSSASSNSSHLDLELKVRNLGDGLGHDRVAPTEWGVPPEDDPASVAETKAVEIDENRERSLTLTNQLPQADNTGRLRRGSYGIGYGDRAGYPGRRGRASFPRSPGRGYGRGYQQSRPPPPFAITPPPHFQPLVPMNDGSFYPPPHHHLTTYIPTGYENFAAPPPMPTPHITPPVPVPMSPISFPLDPTRWYLLGQLEYYLSPDNMAQDYFLKRQMDAKGWIPISLIASFNRVRRLTIDVHLVREVLMLSALVQVKDDWVRMGGWERYVLPDANPSIVESDLSQTLHNHHYQQEQSGQNIADMGIEGEEERDVEEEEEGETEDEEEDVVFVMGQEAGLWVPERQPQI